jgi:nucleoside-diphosphate-sugar epimerase
VKLLVTGGAGYIGSVVAQLLEAMISDARDRMRAHPDGYR